MKREKLWRCALCGWLNALDAKACAGCNKRKPRKKKPLPSPVFRPWRCVILALDPAELSGFSIWDRGSFVESGEFRIYTDDGLREVIRVVEHAKAIAARERVPWVAMAERSWGGYMGPAATHAVGFWTFALRNAQLARARIGFVYPSRWRARELPKGINGSEREIVRASEAETASALVGGRAVGGDEAPAILIGKWASKSGEVGELLPPNERIQT